MTKALLRVRLPLFAALSALCGCAAQTLDPDAPAVVRELAIAPFEHHEVCTALKEGDRLDYRFEARAPVAFGLRYVEGRAVVIPVSRDETQEGSGVFRARFERTYCLRWEAGRSGAILDYRIRRLPEKD